MYLFGKIIKTLNIKSHNVTWKISATWHDELHFNYIAVFGFMFELYVFDIKFSTWRLDFFPMHQLC